MLLKWLETICTCHRKDLAAPVLMASVKRSDSVYHCNRCADNPLQLWHVSYTFLRDPLLITFRRTF